MAIIKYKQSNRSVIRVHWFIIASTTNFYHSDYPSNMYGSTGNNAERPYLPPPYQEPSLPYSVTPAPIGPTQEQAQDNKRPLT